MRCYLLAGGQSRRMGRAKLDLPFAGSTFVERVAAAARGAFEEVVAVQRFGGAAIPGLSTIHEEPHEDAAPVFGVQCALRAPRLAPRAFVMAIDYPLITSAVLSYLRARFEASARPMLVPMWRGRPQLLCAGYDASLRNVIDARIAARRYDLRGLIDEVGAELVAEDELRARFAGEPLMNVNTPEELAEAERLA